MTKRFLSILLVCLFSLNTIAQVNGRIQGDVIRGGKIVKVSSTISHIVEESFPSSTVTVYLTGTLTLATIYSDSIGTLKSNPFTSDSSGFYEFYAAGGLYDVKFSGTGIISPFTRTVTVSTGAVGNAGGDLTGTYPSPTVITGTTANSIVRLNSSGKLPAVDGSLLTNLPTQSLGSPLTYTGTYTDWRLSSAQFFARNTTQIDQGADYWINNYNRSARISGNDVGQFGYFHEMLTSTGTGGFAVPIYGASMSPANNTGTAALYGGNFLIWNGANAAWPDYGRGVEIDVNNYKQDVALREPAGPPGFNTLVGLEAVSGGVYKPDYGIRITSSIPTGPLGDGVGTNKWQVGLRCGIDCFNFRGLELANPSVSQGAGLIVGQALNGFDTINFARNSDVGFVSNFIRYRNGALTTDLFTVGPNGQITTNDSIYVKGALFFNNASGPFIFYGTGSPEGIIVGTRALYIRSDGGPNTTLYVKESGTATSTGWVAK